MAVTIFPSLNDVSPSPGGGKTLKEISLAKWLKSLVSQNFIITGFAPPASSANLTLAIPLGQTCIDGHWVDIDTATNVTCTANATNHIYLKLTKDASQNVTGAVFEVNTTGAPPADSVKIATAVTSGTAVTSTTDMRPFNSPPVSGLRNLLDPATQVYTGASVRYKKNGTLMPANTLRLEQGKFGQMPFVEEGTTNLLTANQSSVETDLTGLALAGIASAKGTLTRITTDKWTGSACAQVVVAGYASGDDLSLATADPTESTDTVASPNTTYTFSAYFKAPADTSVNLRVIQWNSSGGVVEDNILTNVSGNGLWQRITGTLTTAATTAYVSMRLMPIGNGTYLFDGLKPEQKSYATSWITGGSTRTADQLYYTLAQPLPKQNFGALIWTPEQSSAVLANRDYTLMIGANLSAVVTIPVVYRQSINSFLFAKTNDGGTTWNQIASAATSFSAGDRIFVAWMDDPITGNMKLWVGVNNGALSEYTSASTMQITTVQKVYVGANPTAGTEANGTIDFPILSDILPTSAQVEALYRAQDWGGMRNYPGIMSAETKTPTGGTFWHSENDGAGSGLDADTVDTYQPNTGTTASTIPVRDANGNLPGNITGNAATANNATTVGGYAPNTGTTASTIPVRDGTGKLPGSVTGDAATVGGKAPADITSSGTYADTTTSIPANSTYTINIPIGNGKTKAAVSWYGATNIGGVVYCSANNLETISHVVRSSATAHIRSAEEYLSAIGELGTQIYLTECYISGTNLVLVFKNSDAANPNTLNLVKLHWVATI